MSGITPAGPEGAEPSTEQQPTPTWTPPSNQAELDRIIADRLARDRQKFADYGDLKQKAARLDEIEAANKSETEKLQERATQAEQQLSEYRNRLASERVRSALDRALTGRIPDTAALLDLDRAQFIKDDSADVDAITAWATAHSTEAPSATAPKVIDRSQGARPSTGGTLDAGQAAWARRHPQATT